VRSVISDNVVAHRLNLPNLDTFAQILPRIAQY
jgi:hypothetical protein